MGLLDDAIRDHLDLKRRRGADPAEIERAEREALGPVRREPLASEAAEPERLGVGGEALDQHALAEHPADVFEHDEPVEAPEPRRHGLFGRLRRGGDSEHAETHEPEAEAVSPAEPLGAYDEEPWEDEYESERDDEDPFDPEPSVHEGPGTVAFHPPSEWEDEEPPPAPAGELGDVHPGAPEPAVPAPHRATSPPPPAPQTPAPPRQPSRPDPDETAEYDLGSEAPPQRPAGTPPSRPSRGDEAGPDEDVLEETPEFLQDTPDHDRLWFEQRPPRDFDFDG